MHDHWIRWLAAHLGSVVGMAMALPFVALILRSRRSPDSTLAWLLGVLFIPYLGVPLYLILGTRKRKSAGKARLYLDRPRPPAGNVSLLEAILCADGVPGATSANAITLLATGEAAFAALLDLARAARQSIDVATFILGNDETGHAILDCLIDRARAGVKVRLLLDGLFAHRASRSDLDSLRRAGGQVAVFAPLLHVPFHGHDNLRDHRKIFVVDGVHGVTGGMNLATEYMGPSPRPGRWCDVAVHVRGPAVSRMAEIFQSDFAYATRRAVAAPQAAGVSTPLSPAPEGTAAIQVVASGPDAADDSLYDVLLSACTLARERIWIATPYFVPDEALARALRVALRRGVDVRVLVPWRSNHRLADLAGGSYLREIAALGGRIATYPIMLHAKVLCIDRRLGVVGSANFDMRSLFLDYEIALLLSSEPEIELLSAWFEERLATCGTLGPAKRSRLAMEDLGRLFAPLV
jgi:cardiolipin synthase